MNIKIPNSTWTQPNNSDKFGSLAYSKNINLDEEGYIKLSPRTIRLMDDARLPAEFGLPLAIGRYGKGSYQVAGANASGDKNWSLLVSETQNTWADSTGTNEPTLTTDSSAVWFQGDWHASTATAIVSYPASGAAENWTSRVTGLTSGKNHKLCVFQNRVSLCAANGNEVKQYDSSYANTVDLTIPSDYEIVGMAYNSGLLGVITRLSHDGTVGQDQEAMFYTWDGAADSANSHVKVGSDSTLFVAPYKSSFVILNKNGELLYWNGGGFDELASFPFYFSDADLFDNASTPATLTAQGDAPMVVDGDTIYISIGTKLNPIGRDGENALPNSPSGVWCYDPAVGLYHRYSPSVSNGYVNFVSGANINTSTNTLVASAGSFGLETIPATGNIARLTTTAGIGGLSINKDYYIIRVSSTDFKLATTKENALNGIAIDITSATAGNNYFWMYDLVDYGSALYDIAGAIAKTGNDTMVYTSIVVGGRLALPTTLAATDSICVAVPFLENRGYFVISKLQARGIADKYQKVYISYKPLDTNDAIIVKYKPRDVLGLPLASPQEAHSNSHAEWTSTKEFYTSSDLSLAKAYLDGAGGNHLEIEFIAGAGSGQAVRILSISDPEDGVYSVVLEEDVLGASSGRGSYFIIDNWKVLKSVTATTQTNDGILEVPVGDNHKWFFTKVELRGYDTTVELVEPIAGEHKKPV